MTNPNPTVSAILAAERFAEHLQRIISLENNDARARDERGQIVAKLDKLQWWIMSALGTAFLGILTQLMLKH